MEEEFVVHVEIPSWNQLVKLIVQGRHHLVSGLVVVAGEVDRHVYQMSYGPVVTRVPVPAGEYMYTREGDCWRLERTEGSGLVLSDGTTLMWNGFNSPAGSGVGLEGDWSLECASPAFFDDDCLDRLLESAFSAGEIRAGTWLGRPVWRVSGLPHEAQTVGRVDFRVLGDLWEPREMVVDAETGVVLMLTHGTGTAEYTSVEFPGSIEKGMNSWSLPGGAVEECNQTWHGAPEDDGYPVHVSPVIPDPTFEKLLDNLRISSHAPLPNGRRSLHVHGPGPWSVGETAEMRLEYLEADPETASEAVGVAPPLVAYAELHGMPDWRRSLERPWRVMLRGDGWSAGWWAREPITGYVECRGRFTVSDEPSNTATPTRGKVHRISLRCREAQVPGVRGVQAGNRVDAIIHTLDVARLYGCLPYYISGDETVMGTTTDVEVVLDLEESAPPDLAEALNPSVVREFGVTGAGNGRTLWWTPDTSLPMVYWRALATAGTEDSGSALIPVSAEDTWTDPVRIEVGSDGCEGTLPCAGQKFELRRWWNLPRRTPEGPGVQEVPGWRCGEWFIEYREGALVRSDAQGHVVGRLLPEPCFEEFCGVGPWVGCVSVDWRGAEFQLRDPVTFYREAAFRVESTPVCAQWFDGELWLADGRLRVMTPTSPGLWDERIYDSL